MVINKNSSRLQIVRKDRLADLCEDGWRICSAEIDVDAAMLRVRTVSDVSGKIQKSYSAQAHSQ
jgi:hypothetical protein